MKGENRARDIKSLVKGISYRTSATNSYALQTANTIKALRGAQATVLFAYTTMAENYQNHTHKNMVLLKLGATLNE